MNPPSQRPSLLPEGTPRRFLSLAGVIVLAAAAMGVLTGIRPPEKRDPFIHSSHEAPSGGEPARSYAELRQGRRGPNAAVYAGAFDRLRAAGPGLLDPVLPQTEEARQAALAARTARRAFAGAPPVVPHELDQRTPGACLSCHGSGAQIGKKIAPAMSHRPYAVCVQCHAAEEADVPPALVPSSVSMQSEFERLPEPGRGEVAWEGAPPTIPHPTLMRENCSSCHGRLGAQGLRTPHPYQQSCTQCHASGGSFDPGRPPAL